MPRRAANPDPAIETYTRSRDGKVFEIHAFRDGTFQLHADGALVSTHRDTSVGAGYAFNRYPSNRLQSEAMKRAKAHIELALI